MHGTFRGRIEGGAGMMVRFDAPAPVWRAPRRGRAKLVALLAGCCVAVLPIASLPMAWRNAERQPPARPKRTVQVETPGVVVPAPTMVSPEAPKAATSTPHALTISPSREPIRLPEPQAIAGVAVTDIPKIDIAPSAPPPVAVELPDPASRLAVADSSAPLPADTGAPTATTLRPVDIEQVADSEVRSMRVPQLNEPSLAAGGEPALSIRIAAMQVTPLPPPRLRDSDRAALLAEAPTRLTLRVGASTLGKVDFRMSDAHTIDVKLSGLLDLLAGHYDAAEFARLRSSAAADAYVSVDQLRALGLTVRYDPAYDELRVNG
jgi:hypothetical protein